MIRCNAVRENYTFFQFFATIEIISVLRSLSRTWKEWNKFLFESNNLKLICHLHVSSHFLDRWGLLIKFTCFLHRSNLASYVNGWSSQKMELLIITRYIMNAEKGVTFQTIPNSKMSNIIKIFIKINIAKSM